MRKLKLARVLMWMMSIVPKRYQLKSSTPLIQPFFILGSGRNGSTLLNMILNQHSQLFLPPEQYFLGNSLIKYQIYNFILWRDLVKVIYGELLNTGDSHKWDFSVNKVMMKAFHLEGDERNLQHLIGLLYKSYSQKTNKLTPMWGDSTNANTYYTNEIYNCFPKAKFIFLIRDGRDVVSAYKKGGVDIFDHLGYPATATTHWIKSIKKYHWIKKRTDVLVVKYEELVQNTEENIKRILTFLGQEYQPSLDEFYKNVPKVAEYDQDHHKNLQNPINTSSIGQWKKLLTESEKNALIPQLTPYLKEFNYL